MNPDRIKAELRLAIAVKPDEIQRYARELASLQPPREVKPFARLAGLFLRIIGK